MSITHAKVSAVADSGDTDLVQPTDWNAGHVVTSIALSGGPSITTGAGDPESSVTASPASLYLRTDGTVYIKASGSGSTGWLAILTSD